MVCLLFRSRGLWTAGKATTGGREGREGRELATLSHSVNTRPSDIPTDVR